MTIGLRKDAVKLVKHNPKWKILFEQERKKLRGNLDKRFVDIEHIGSTAIPGLYAKPIIDIAVGVDKMRNVQEYIKIIEKHGYTWRPKFGRVDQHLVFTKGNGEINKYHLHVMKYKGKIWKDRLLFRDYLRKNKEYFRKYQDLKSKLANKFPNDRKIYTASKKDFVASVLKIAYKD